MFHFHCQPQQMFRIITIFFVSFEKEPLFFSQDFSRSCLFNFYNSLLIPWATSVFILFIHTTHYLAKWDSKIVFFCLFGWTEFFFVEPSKKKPKSLDDNDDSMLCKRVVTKDRRYITQITCYEKGKEGGSQRQAMRMPLFGKQGGGVLSSLFSKIGRQGMAP
jgi:hypothetical protein